MKKEVFTKMLKLGALAAVVAAAFPEFSWAQALVDTTNTVVTGISKMPTIVSGGCYLMGACAVGHGAVLLTKTATDHNQTPAKQGLTHIGTGAFIAALPPAIEFTAKTLARGTGDDGFRGLKPIVMNVISSVQSVLV